MLSVAIIVGCSWMLVAICTIALCVQAGRSDREQSVTRGVARPARRPRRASHLRPVA